MSESASPPRTPDLREHLRAHLERLKIRGMRYLPLADEPILGPDSDGDPFASMAAEVDACRLCPIGHTRSNAVFGSGSADADLVFVGEAPGADEDRQGLPFVGRAGELLTRIIEAMTATLFHRGPDDGDTWRDEDARLALGHRRLSIIDLSQAGRQPMISANGRLAIVYNGEVYNFAELRTELMRQGCGFRGHSDTEVILEACALWGIERTVPRLIGMFAFALWDRDEHRLTLVRDRLGVKPLYWADLGGTILFGSELKSLWLLQIFEHAQEENIPTSLAADRMARRRIAEARRLRDA